MCIHIFNNRTISSIHILNQEEREKEIARFISTSNIDEIAIKNAKDILKKQKLIKNTLNN